MNQRTRIGLIVTAVGAVIGLIFLCMTVIPRNSGSPVPAPSVSIEPEPQETEDCDKEDRAKREWEECGFGVLLEPGKSAKPATITKSPAAKCTKIPARKC